MIFIVDETTPSIPSSVHKLSRNKSCRLATRHRRMALCGYRRCTHFSSVSSTWEPYSASFQPFSTSSTYTDKNNPCFRCTQFGTSSHPSPNRPFSNCLSHKRPASTCPYKFRSKRTTGPSMLVHDFGHFISWKTYPYRVFHRIGTFSVECVVAKVLIATHPSFL